MISKIAVHTKSLDGGTVVRILVKGLQDNAGKSAQDSRISEVTGYLNNTTLISTHANGSLARDPFLQFRIKGTKKGDVLRIVVTDMKGRKDSVERVLKK